MTMLPPDPLYIFKGEMLPVSCVTFKITPPTGRIYAGTQSGLVHVWNLRSKREIGNFKAGDDICLSVCIPEEENVIITHTKTGCISFWTECGNNNEWQLKKAIKIDFFGFCKSYTYDNILYAPLKRSRCEVISVKSMNSTQTVGLGEGDLGEIMAFKVCRINNRTLVLVAHERPKLILWDFNELDRISTLELDECPMAFDYDVKTNKGLLGDPNDKILIFSLDKNLKFKKIRNVQLPNPGVSCVRIRPDGKLVAVGCWDGKVRLYSWKTFVLLAVLDSHNATVQEVSFSENYTEASKIKYLLAVGSLDGRISLWDLYN